MTIGFVEFYSFNKKEPDTSTIKSVCETCSVRQRCAPTRPGIVIKTDGKESIEVLGILAGTDECELPSVIQ